MSCLLADEDVLGLAPKKDFERMANQFRSSVGGVSSPPEGAGPVVYEKPSNLMSVGVVILPLVFGWFTFWRPYSPTRKILTGLWMALSLVVLVNNAGSGNQTGAPPANGRQNSDAQSDAVGSWTYSEDRDPMRGTVFPFARTSSLNQVNLASPYEGGSTLTLRLYKDHKTGADLVSFYIDKGQFLCNEFEGQSITVRFDEGALQRFTCADSGDANTQVMFINSEKRFISNLKKARRVTLEVPLFQAGNQQFSFDVEHLKW